MYAWHDKKYTPTPLWCIDKKCTPQLCEVYWQEMNSLTSLSWKSASCVLSMSMMDSLRCIVACMSLNLRSHTLASSPFFLLSRFSFSAMFCCKSKLNKMRNMQIDDMC